MKPLEVAALKKQQDDLNRYIDERLATISTPEAKKLRDFRSAQIASQKSQRGPSVLQQFVENTLLAPETLALPVGIMDAIFGGAAKQAEAIAVPGWLGPGQVGKVVKAQKLKKAGVSDESIHEQTGIYNDPVSGAAKRIISDKDAALDLTKFRPNPFYDKLKGLNSFDEYTLPDIMHHPELYQVMPELREIKVINSFMGPPDSAYFDAAKKTIALGPATDADTLLRTVLHETEHAANDVYGTGAGGSYKAFLPDPGQFQREQNILFNSITEAKKTGNTPLLKQLEELRKKFEEVQTQAVEKYKRIGGEASARATETMHLQQSWDKYPLKQIKDGGYYDVPIEELIASPLDK